MEFFSPKNVFHLIKIKALYRRAFPLDERKPFSMITKMKKKGKTDIWYFEDGGRFLGLAITINGEREILIDYFAVSEELRGKGYGHKMLSALLEYYLPRGVFLEIEIPYEDAENYTERVRRKRFYESVGLSPMQTYVKLFGVDMELLGVGCSLSFDEYRDFYLKNYGRFAYDNIKPVG